MKKTNLLFATLCSAMFFAACSNEDNPLEGETSKKQFTVNLKADFDLVATRAGGTPAENVLGNTRILLYDGSGNVLGNEVVTGLTGSQTINLTGSATSDQVRHVYVLTNTEITDDFKLELTTAGDYSKSVVDASSITVDDYTGLPDHPKLPFVGSTSTITSGAATVNISRRVARLIVNNQTSGEIDVEYNNLASKFSNFVPDSINESPTVFAHNILTSNLAGSSADTLYVLPNSATVVGNQTVINVTYKGVVQSVTIPAVVGNNTYTYTVTATESGNINVTGTANTEWGSGTNGNINTSIPTVSTPASASDVYAGTQVELSGLTDATGLSVTSDKFQVSFAPNTRAGGVIATVKPKLENVENPYDEFSELLEVQKDGAVVAKINAVNKFKYEEVNVGPATFMDRDLGAPAAGEPGDLFVAGWQKGLDQATSSFSKKAAYSGNGRLAPSTSWTGFGTDAKWFTNADGSKNETADPCPRGWHVMTKAEVEYLFTNSTSVPSNGVVTGSGGLGGQTTITGQLVTFTKDGKSLKFSLETGQWDRNFSVNSQWPTAWYTSTKESGKYVQFTIGLTSPKEVQIKANNALGSAGVRGYQIRCVKD